jgi:hypothetical protein
LARSCAPFFVQGLFGDPEADANSFERCTGSSRETDCIEKFCAIFKVDGCLNSGEVLHPLSRKSIRLSSLSQVGVPGKLRRMSNAFHAIVQTGD